MAVERVLAKQCYICLEGDDGGKLMRGCACRGDSAGDASMFAVVLRFSVPVALELGRHHDFEPGVNFVTPPFFLMFRCS